MPKELYQSRRYSTTHNMHKVKSGLDQAGWESSGWINECDPRGWTQGGVCVVESLAVPVRGECA